MIGPTRAQQAKRVLECPPHRKLRSKKPHRGPGN
jgi:hypothetical protein